MQQKKSNQGLVDPYFPKCPFCDAFRVTYNTNDFLNVYMFASCNRCRWEAVVARIKETGETVMLSEQVLRGIYNEKKI